MTSFRFRLRPLAFFLLFLMSAAPVLRAGDFPQISKEEMDIKSVPEQPGASAVILFYEQVNDDNRHFKSIYVRLKVLTEAGRKYGDVEIRYGKGDFYQTVEELRGRTTHADGSVARLEGKPLDKLIVKSKDVKYNAKVFTLPDVQPGSIIEYSYIIRYPNTYVVAPHWDLQQELFQRKIRYRFNNSDAQIMLPHDQLSGGTAYIVRLPKGVAVKGDSLGFELNMTNVAAQVDEEMMPPAGMESQYVKFYYRTRGKLEDFWKDEAKFWNKDMEKYLGKRGGVDAAVAQTVAASDTPEQKLRKIYAFIDSLENTTYLPERTAQELKTLNIKPSESVEDVLRKKSGDREELARLFVAMARSAGIPAYLAKVSNRSYQIFEPKLLDADQLDDDLAIVELNGQEQYLDPGTKHCPFGMLRWQYTSSTALRQLPGKGAGLADTPLPQVADATTKRVGRFRLTEDGQLEGSLIVVWSGREALSRRLEGARTDATGREKILLDEVKGWLPSNAEVTLSKQQAWDDAEKSLIAEFKIVTPALTNAGKRVLLPLDVLQFGRKPVFTHAERQHSIIYRYPSREVDELHIALPANLAVESLPANQSVDLPYAMYRATRGRSGNEIVVGRDFAVAILFVQLDKYKEVKEFYDKVKEGDDQQAVLRGAVNATGN
jgi:hypothetical protein